MMKPNQWIPMKLTYVGDVHALLTMGGAKLTIVAGDPGEEMRKPPGMG